MLNIKKFLFLAMLPLATCASGVSYKVDTTKSKVEWNGKKKFIGSPHHGHIKISSGVIDFNGQIPVKATFVVDMNSIVNVDVEDPKWRKKLEDHLKSDDFFASNKYKTATFSAHKFEKKGTNQYKVSGKLTIRNKTNAVSFVATVTKSDKKTFMAEGDLVFNRLDFDVMYNKDGLVGLAKDKIIAEDVSIKIKLVAHI